MHRLWSILQSLKYHRRVLLNLIAVVLLCIAISQLASRLLPQLLTGTFIDYAVYEQASYQFIRGNSPYFLSSEGLPFFYPPAAVVFLSFFVLLAGTNSLWLFTILSLASFFVSIWLVLTSLAYTRKEHWLAQYFIQYPFATWCITTAFVLQTFPAKLTLANGQINSFVLLCVALGFYYLARERNLVAILFWSLASVLKVYPAILIFSCVLHKRWREAVLFVIISAGTNLLFPHFFLTYLQTVVSSQLRRDLTYITTAADQSLTALLLRAHLPIGSVSVFILIAAGIYLFMLYERRKNTTQLETAAVLLPLIFILGHPVWSHQLVLLFPYFLFELSAPALFITWALLALPIPVSEAQDTRTLLHASVFPVFFSLLLYSRIHLRFRST